MNILITNYTQTSYIHQKLTEKLTESDSTLCHQRDGINKISPATYTIKNNNLGMILITNSLR